MKVQNELVQLVQCRATNHIHTLTDIVPPLRKMQ